MENCIDIYTKLIKITKSLNESDENDVIDNLYEPYIYITSDKESVYGYPCATFIGNNIENNNLNKNVYTSSLLRYKTRELAEHSIFSFQDLWKEFFGINKDIKIRYHKIK